jgi:hypothetical protein
VSWHTAGRWCASCCCCCCCCVELSVHCNTRPNHVAMQCCGKCLVLLVAAAAAAAAASAAAASALCLGLANAWTHSVAGPAVAANCQGCCCCWWWCLCCCCCCCTHRLHVPRCLEQVGQLAEGVIVTGGVHKNLNNGTKQHSMAHLSTVQHATLQQEL